MDSFKLNWPGFGDFPVFLLDHETGEIYHEGFKLPPDKENMDCFNNRYVSLEAVMALFPAKGMAKARIQLLLLEQHALHFPPIIKNEETGMKFIHLQMLLIFMLIYPFCPEFQRARSSVLRFLTQYPDLTCMKCGFIYRDCRCKPKLQKFSKPEDRMPSEVVAKLTAVTESGAQTETVSCPICKDPVAFQNSKNPMLVMPPGLKINPGDKFPLSMFQNATTVHPTFSDPMSTPLPTSSSPANLPPASQLVSRGAARGQTDLSNGQRYDGADRGDMYSPYVSPYPGPGPTYISGGTVPPMSYVNTSMYPSMQRPYVHPSSVYGSSGGGYGNGAPPHSMARDWPYPVRTSMNYQISSANLNTLTSRAPGQTVRMNVSGGPSTPSGRPQINKPRLPTLTVPYKAAKKAEEEKDQPEEKKDEEAAPPKKKKKRKRKSLYVDTNFILAGPKKKKVPTATLR